MRETSERRGIARPVAELKTKSAVRLADKNLKRSTKRSRRSLKTDEMIVGLLTAHLYMQGIASLKDKRSIIKGLIGRLKSRFNISIAEVDHQDNKTSAVIAITMVSNDSRFIDQQFDAIIKFMRNDGRFYLGEVSRETFNS
jgi:uncharacterized protein YlxP (DUF503 family)